jgi:hypothetical protein
MQFVVHRYLLIVSAEFRISEVVVARQREVGARFHGNER